jgi:hypothetical protein
MKPDYDHVYEIRMANARRAQNRADCLGECPNGRVYRAVAQLWLRLAEEWKENR